MKKINLALLTLVFSLITSSLFAHALWIETSSTGIAGKEQSVKIYYGEFVENERDSVSKWYSDIKNFSLWLVGPDQKKIQLKTMPGVNYYEARFTPVQNGKYTLAVSHYAKELGGTSRYNFLATADVTVGKPAGNSAVVVNLVQFQKQENVPAKVNKPLTIQLMLNKVPAIDKTIKVFSPNGWSKELKTDANGRILFVPPFPGRYVTEISDQDKTSGDHDGKPYTETWNTASYCIEVF
jgi:uncharacterized GH25 family protein